jgi:hypothetical protein
MNSAMAGAVLSTCRIVTRLIVGEVNFILLDYSGTSISATY